MVFDWNEEKNAALKAERGIGFERIVLAIEDGRLVDVLEHPNQDRYGGQLLLLVNVDAYIYVVPTVQGGDYWFLKTIFPSRKYTERYLRPRRS